MPRLSDTMQEGTIAKWLKQTGDAVKRGDVLAQIETDKATMDLEAYENGTLAEILAQEGATVAIGQPIARIGSGTAAAPAAAPPPNREPPSEAPTVTIQPAGAARGSVQPPTAAAPANVEAALNPVRSGTAVGVGAKPPAATPTQDGPSPAQNGKVRASPLARRIAEEHGVDLAAVRGTGPEGRVIRVDVEAVLASGGSPPEAPPDQTAPPRVAAGPRDERVPLTRMRKTIARRMAESTRTVPHFFLTSVADVTDLVSLRKQIVAQQEAAGQTDARVTLNDFIVKACATALRRMPEVNVSFDEDALIRHGQVNVGIAVSLENGLVVPVVRNADALSLSQIAGEVRALAGRARDGKLRLEEYAGGTFTVSNLGMFGVEHFSAVINPPEAAILAVGAALREPAEHDGEIALRDRLRLTLSVDHRAVDGATGARFLQVVKSQLEQPLLLML